MRKFIGLTAMAAVVIVTACSINVKKDEQGQDKNVDINTPFGGIHVNEGADARETGLPVSRDTEPLTTVARGAGSALEELGTLRRTSKSSRGRRRRG